MERAGRSLNVHLYTSTIEYESRMERITSYLAREATFSEIHLVGVRRAGLPDEAPLDEVRRIVRLGPPSPAGTNGIGSAKRLAAWSRAIWRRYKDEPLACVNPHNVTTLPIAALLKRRTGCKLVYDTHELETETTAQRGLRKHAFRRIERALIPRVDHTVVVGDAIADWYRKRYRLANVTTVRNLPRATAATAHAGPTMRERFSIPPQDVLVLYQGVLNHGRSIPQILDAFDAEIPGVRLVMMGYGPLEKDLEAAAARRPWIHAHPAVPPGEVRAYSREADIGLALGDNVSLSYYLSLPNKLFEYIHAGVVPVVSDFPEMARVVKEIGAGWAIAPEAAPLRRVLLDLDPKRLAEAKDRVERAKDAYRWEDEVDRLRDVYGSLGLLRPGAERLSPPRRSGAHA